MTERKKDEKNQLWKGIRTLFGEQTHGGAISSKIRVFQEPMLRNPNNCALSAKKPVPRNQRRFPGCQTKRLEQRAFRLVLNS